MKTLFNRFVQDESGATAIEYGLIAALIAVAIIAALNGRLRLAEGRVHGDVEPQLDTAARPVTARRRSASMTGAGLAPVIMQP